MIFTITIDALHKTCRLQGDNIFIVCVRIVKGQSIMIKIHSIKSVTRVLLRWYSIVWKKCSTSDNCIHNNINCNTQTTNYAETFILKPIRTKVIGCFRISLYIIIIYSRSLYKSVLLSINK